MLFGGRHRSASGAKSPSHERPLTLEAPPGLPLLTSQSSIATLAPIQTNDACSSPTRDAISTLQHLPVCSSLHAVVSRQTGHEIKFSAAAQNRKDSMITVHKETGRLV